MKKVSIYTLGCKANQADSDTLGLRLARAGCTIVSYKERADFYIINTCTVTSKAAYQSRQVIRRLIRREPPAEVVVMGCDVEAEREVLEKIEGVSLLVGREEVDKIVDFITKDEGGGTKDENSSITEFKRARPFVRIQDGCENFCSYCIVPYVRGPLKSFPIDTIVDDIERWSKAGYYEVVLTGIHIGKYGVDLKGQESLTLLLKEVLSRTTIPRLRLSSIESDELSDELIKLIAESDRICPHLHIPLQSGSDATLKRMNRGYTTTDYRSCINKVVDAIPNVTVGADLITGFPGETEEEYLETCRFVESLPLTYLHVFPYSDREGTKAYQMTDKIHDSIKRTRSAKLRDISQMKRAAYLEKNIGSTVAVVYDRKKIGEYWKGVSENYIQVLVKDRSVDLNHETVRLERVSGDQMHGSRLSV